MIKNFTKLKHYDIVTFKTYHHIDELSKDKTLFNVKKLTFESLYYHLIINLIENKFLEYEYNIDKNNYQYFKILNIGSNLINFNSYIDNMFDFITSKNKNIFYIDTDTIYYIGNLDLEGIDDFLKYKIEDIYCLRFSRLKSISYIKGNEIFYNKRTVRESTLLELRSVLRNKKIKELIKK